MNKQPTAPEPLRIALGITLGICWGTWILNPGNLVLGISATVLLMILDFDLIGHAQRLIAARQNAQRRLQSFPGMGHTPCRKLKESHDAQIYGRSGL